MANTNSQTTSIPTTVQKSFSPQSREIRYLNKDFSSFKENLINFAKYYYPNTYKDFSNGSVGIMFIEMAAVVGDVLSYYIDYSQNEGLISNATERKNILSLAKYLGYTTSPTKASTGTIEVYQICPSIYSNGTYIPDPNFLLSINENMQVSNNSGAYFLTSQPIDFSVNTLQSPLTTTIYQTDSNGVPTFFLLQKTINIRAGQLVTTTFTINNSQPYLDLYLSEQNVLEIINVVDSDNNQWYQVDYLAQETVLSSVPNNSTNQGILSQYQSTVPYILNYLSTSYRFTVNVDENNMTYLEFGSGTSDVSNEIINLSSQNVGVGLTNISNLNISLDPSNFLDNDTYGLAPQNTTLTVTYTIGGGFQSNSPSNSIINVNSVTINNTTDGLTVADASLLNTVKTSLRVNNSAATTGGSGPESNDVIRQNAIANFAAQNRIVTQQDYLARVYALPPQFGQIAKAQVITYNSLNVNQNQILTGTVDNNGTNIATVNNNNTQNYFRQIAYDINNPFAVNLYILSYDQNGNLTQANEALITNLLTYLRQFRIMTDSINIIDGYIINIGVQFSITTYVGYNKQEVLANAITTVQNFFNIDNWEFSQPINLSNLSLQIANVQGVQSVTNLEIMNLTPTSTGGGNYSSATFDIAAATKNNLIFPSLDPMCWEVKFPGQDIVGSAL